MYIGIDFITEFIIGLFVGCVMWVFRGYLLPRVVMKKLLDIRTNREREKAQAFMADMDRYQQVIKQQQYWMNRDWLAQKLHEEAAYEQKTRR